MNNIIKYCSILLLLLASPYFISNASAADCKTPPNCSSVGYTKKISDCPNGYVKCPWDTSKIYCPPSTDNSIPCEVGSVVYENLKCYTMGTTSKLPIAVVVDAEKGFAVSLKERESEGRWGNIGIDLPALVNCTSSYARRCYASGSLDTSEIMKLPNANEYIAAYYSTNYSTAGTKPRDWFLPSMFELGLLAGAILPINSGIKSVMGTPVSGAYWSSTEYSGAGAWLLVTSNNSDMNTGKGDSHSIRPFINYLNPGFVDDLAN